MQSQPERDAALVAIGAIRACISDREDDLENLIDISLGDRAVIEHLVAVAAVLVKKISDSNDLKVEHLLNLVTQVILS